MIKYANQGQPLADAEGRCPSSDISLLFRFFIIVLPLDIQKFLEFGNIWTIVSLVDTCMHVQLSKKCPKFGFQEQLMPLKVTFEINFIYLKMARNYRYTTSFHVYLE